MNGVFITGTDTEVGKTYFTRLWTQALRKLQIPVLALKPIVCGERTDAELLYEANDRVLSLDSVNPIWLRPPLSPYAATVVEEKPFDWEKLRAHWNVIRAQQSGPLLVEGVGGWLVPLDPVNTVRDWAVELGLPVIIVCRAGLGTINHTLLTVESVRAAGLPILGIVMNFHNTPDDFSALTNASLLENLTGLPLFKIEEGTTALDLPEWLKPWPKTQ